MKISAKIAHVIYNSKPIEPTIANKPILVFTNEFHEQIGLRCAYPIRTKIYCQRRQYQYDPGAYLKTTGQSDKNT